MMQYTMIKPARELIFGRLIIRCHGVNLYTTSRRVLRLFTVAAWAQTEHLGGVAGENVAVLVGSLL